MISVISKTGVISKRLGSLDGWYLMRMVGDNLIVLLRTFRLDKWKVE